MLQASAAVVCELLDEMYCSVRKIYRIDKNLTKVPENESGTLLNLLAAPEPTSKQTPIILYLIFFKRGHPFAEKLLKDLQFFFNNFFMLLVGLAH